LWEDKSETTDEGVVDLEFDWSKTESKEEEDDGEDMVKDLNGRFEAL